MDLSKLSTEDLQALRSGDLTKVSTAGLQTLRSTAPVQKPDLTSGQGLRDTLGKMTSNDPSVGAAEMLFNHAGSVIARIPAGLAGLVTSVGNALGVTNKDPADVVQGVQQAATYQPQTASGQAGMQFEHGLVAPVAKAADKGLGVAGHAIGGQTGENVVRTVVPAAADAAMSVTPLASAAGALRAAAIEGGGAAIPSSVEGAMKPSDSTPLATARGAGYKARPSDITAANPGDAAVQPGLAAKVGEKLGGSAAQKQTYTLQNQARTTQLAGQDIGLGDDVTKITPDMLAKAKTAPGAQYDATGQAVGTFKGSQPLRDSLTQIEQDPAASATAKAEARRLGAVIDSGGSFQGPQVVKLISKLRDAQGGRQVANVLESEIDRQLSADPQQAETLQNFRDARQQFAKIYTVQDALKKGGQVDAQTIGRVHAANPNLLTGNLRVIGTAANELPGVTGRPVAGGSSGPGIVQSVLGAPARAIMGSKVVQNATTGARAMTPTEASYVPSFGKRPAAPGPAIIGPARQLTNEGSPIPMGQEGFAGDTESEAGAQHPGAPRTTNRLGRVLALPAPGSIPVIVDSEGRAAAVPSDMDRYLQALGIQRPAPVGLPEIMGGASDSTQSVGRAVQNRIAGDKAAPRRRAAAKSSNTSARRGED